MKSKEMKMTNTEILYKINNLLVELDAQDLTTVAQSTMIRARTLTNISFKIGDEVQFDAKTRGVKTGILIKKNPKTSKVLVEDHTGRRVTWTVTSTLLKKVS
jgi:hypothetical protein